MTDIVSQEKRSNNMRAIKSKDTKPEVYFRHLLFNMGFRYRNNVSYVPGHPDLFLRKYNLAVFVNGCFWHRHKGCQYAYMPKSRIEFWKKKFEANETRDNVVAETLRQKKIRQLVVWECTLKKMQKDPEYEKKVLNEINDFIRSDIQFMEY